jgi:hypothetical protein
MQQHVCYHLFPPHLYALQAGVASCDDWAQLGKDMAARRCGGVVRVGLRQLAGLLLKLHSVRVVYDYIHVRPSQAVRVEALPLMKPLVPELAYCGWRHLNSCISCLNVYVQRGRPPKRARARHQARPMQRACSARGNGFQCEIYSSNYSEDRSTAYKGRATCPGSAATTTVRFQDRQRRT